MRQINSYIKTKFVKLIVLAFLRISNQVFAIECGLPGIPLNSKINETKSKYSDGSKIEYKCEFEDMSLIGDRIRTCVDGKWTGSIPRCGNL